MSTEHLQYSPENQLEVIRKYTAAHQMEIVREYSDFGRSGLNIAGREGLNQLMADVENKRADISALLVYDVSRWRRFQENLIADLETLSPADIKKLIEPLQMRTLQFSIFVLTMLGEEVGEQLILHALEGAKASIGAESGE